MDKDRDLGALLRIAEMPENCSKRETLVDCVSGASYSFEALVLALRNSFDEVRIRQFGIYPKDYTLDSHNKKELK